MSEKKITGRTGSAEFTSIVWVDIRGRELVLAFCDWIEKERPHVLAAVPAGGVSGDRWSHGYTPEDAERIRKWVEGHVGKVRERFEDGALVMKNVRGEVVAKGRPR